MKSPILYAITLFICFMIYYFYKLRKISIEKSEINSIRKGEIPKRIITKKEMLKIVDITANCVYVIIIIVAIITTRILPLSNISLNYTYIPNILLYIVFIFIFIIIPLILILRTILSLIIIMTDNYKIEKDTLSDKFKSINDGKISFYFLFENHRKKIRTTNQDYSTSKIGDKFYIIKAGITKKAYNTNIYELDDESKITTKVG